MHSIDVESVIDSTAISARQWVIFALCASIAMLEGFDLQALAFAAPDIARQWHVPSSYFGPAFSAGLFGGMLGGFVVGQFGDRLGPKPTLLLSILSFAIFTAATAFASSIEHLILFRALAGFGLGAALPGTISIVASYMPRRVRSTVVATTIAMQMAGAVLGGTICSELIPRSGWPSAFILGGVLPIALLPLLIWLVPSPLSYLIFRGAPSRQIASILRGMGKTVPDDAHLVGPERSAASRKATIATLLADGRATSTACLWIMCFAGGMLIYFLSSWLPVMLRDRGSTASGAIIGGVILSAGGMLGALIISWTMNRAGPYRSLMVSYAMAAVAIVAISLLPGDSSLLFGTIFVIGFAALGGQMCLSSLMIHFFPDHLHGSAIGSSVVFGRAGATIGPLVGSYIMIQGGGWHDLFYFAAMLAAIAGLATVGMSRASQPRRASENGVAAA